jgi:coenzyme F420-dependent glucose-6-phosphate dehydrogenase
VIIHTGIAWAQDDDAVIDGARGWRGAQPDSVYTDAVGTPEEIQKTADEEGVDDDTLRSGFVISADANEHIERLREMEGLGADVLCLQNVSGADPLGTIRTYGEKVLPALRGG